MSRFFFWMYIILSLFIPISSTAVLGNNKSVDSSSVIQAKDSLLTVKVKDLPLKKVLKEIASQVPIKIVSFVSTEELIVADFSRLPMRKGLKQLLRDYNYVFVCSPEKSKSGENGIRKVIISSKRGESLHEEAEPMIVFTGEQSLESLIKDLHDEDPNVREYALGSLAELEDARSIDLITEVLLNDEDEYVRMSAVDLLGYIGSEVAIGSLSEALQDENVEVRESAVEALGVIRALEGALSDEVKDVRMSAVEVLGDIGSEVSIDSLRKVLQDEDVEVRKSAMGALGAIGGDEAVLALEGTLLLEEDEDLWQFATEVLSSLEEE